MKILVIGRGHLGTFLNDRLKPAIHYKGVLDHLEQNQIDQVDVVVNTVGKTSLPYCEDNPHSTWDSNVVQPLKLLRKMRGQLLVHISSGCVWDGPYDESGHAFEPTSPVKPACFYSWTKAACDAMMMQEALSKLLVILRPRQVYSPLKSTRNTLTKLQVYPKLIDTPNSMTSAETIAKTIEAVASERLIALNGRIMNVFDLGVTSPYRVGMLLHEAGLREKPEMMTKSNLDLELKPKRVDTVLNDETFMYRVSPPKVEDELRRVIGEYAKTVS